MRALVGAEDFEPLRTKHLGMHATAYAAKTTDQRDVIPERLFDAFTRLHTHVVRPQRLRE